MAWGEELELIAADGQGTVLHSSNLQSLELYL